MKANLSLPSIFVALSLVSTASGAVLNLGDYLKTTDGDQTFSAIFNNGEQMFSYDSGDVYVVMDMTFTNPTNPGTLDTTGSYGGYSHSSGDILGQAWERSNLSVGYYGTRNIPELAPVAIVPGTALTMVIKYELNGVGVDGDTVKIWVNPTLGTGVEGAPSDSDPSRIWNPAVINSDDMRFRRGQDSENHILFSNVTIYDGGSSPFSAVPEPSTALLGALGLFGTLRRRRQGV
jgi:hypothetical protein